MYIGIGIGDSGTSFITSSFSSAMSYEATSRYTRVAATW